MFHRCLLIYFKWHFPDLLSTTFSQSKRKRNQHCNLQALLRTSNEGETVSLRCASVSQRFWLPSIARYANPPHLPSSVSAQSRRTPISCLHPNIQQEAPSSETSDRPGSTCNKYPCATLEPRSWKRVCRTRWCFWSGRKQHVKHNLVIFT